MERISVEEVYVDRETYIGELVISKPITLPMPGSVLRAYIPTQKHLQDYLEQFGDHLVEWVDGKYEVRKFETSIAAAHQRVLDHCDEYGCE